MEIGAGVEKLKTSSCVGLELSSSSALTKALPEWRDA